jgi:PRC-barrel domain
MVPDSMFAASLVGRRADDVYGARIGKVAAVYLELEQEGLSWLAVRLGHFGREHVLVPAQDAIFGPGRVWVPYARDLVQQAPTLPDPGAPLRRAEVDALAGYYAVDGPAAVGSPSEIVARTESAYAASE